MVNILNSEIGKLYYDYLISLIDFDDKCMLYETLLEHLFNMEFVWLESVPLDRNRAVDGINYRRYYLNLFTSSSANNTDKEVIEFNNLFENRPCSLLEMFVAFAVRLTQIISLDASQFFWMFIDNLQLGWATEYDFDASIVDQTLHDFMYGTINNQEPIEGQNPPVLFPCKEVYRNLDKDLFMQANLYFKNYFL